MAHSLPPEEILAYSVALQEMESSTHRYDWEAGEWVDTVAEEKARAAEAAAAAAEEAEEMEARAHAATNRFGRV